MKNMDQWGSGIPRLMENCQKAGLKEPELMEIGGSFRINMFRNIALEKQAEENKSQNNVQDGTQDSLDSTQDDLDTFQDVMLDLTNTDKKLLSYNKTVINQISIARFHCAAICCTIIIMNKV